jgi:hypothetical protein
MLVDEEESGHRPGIVDHGHGGGVMVRVVVAGGATPAGYELVITTGLGSMLGVK